MDIRFLILLLMFLLGSEVVSGQIRRGRPMNETEYIEQRSEKLDTIAPSVKENSSNSSFPDQSTRPTQSINPDPNVQVSDSDLDRPLVYSAQDSQWYDNKNNLMHLYGDAKVKYGDKELAADLIILDMENKIAEARISPVKKNSAKPVFKDGDKEILYNGLKYNFETEKGIVYNAITNEGEFIIHGERTKYVSKGSDLYSVNDDVIYNANSLITTCNHEHPHFGFKAKKLKVIPDKVVVSGPSNLQIAGVPTPLWIPFGFFPLTKGSSTGLIFPQGYEFYSRNLGFGLQGFGWYFPFNDYVHSTLTANYYTKGTWGLDLNTNYKVKYKYYGNVDLSFDNFKTEVLTSDGKFERRSNPGFTISITHNQDGKAHPYRTFQGKMSIVGNNNQRRVNNDASSVLTNTYRSNFTFSHKMPRTPFSLRVGMRHDQNTNTNLMNITLPEVTLTMNTVYPFEIKNKGGNKQRWYEKIALGYDSKMRVFTTTTDSTLFTNETLENARSGMSHNADLSLSTRVFKYFNLVPSIDYSETWVLNTTSKDLVTLTDIGVDSTLTFRDSVITNVMSDPATFRNYSANINLSTQLFGTKTFKRGRLKGVRHLMKPRVGFRYAPDRTNFLDTLEYFDGIQRIQSYSKFDEGPFGSPNFTELQSQLTYGLDNVIEMKYLSRKDSTEKKAKLFDNISFSGSYNFAADSLKWSQQRIRSTSRFFNGITQLSSTWTFDPYVKINGRRINTTVKSQTGKSVRLERGNINLSNRISIKKLIAFFSKDEDEEARPVGQRGAQENGGQGFDEGFTGIDDDIVQNNAGNFGDEENSSRLISFSSLFDKFNLRHELRYELVDVNGTLESKMTDHTLALSGSFDLNANWTISVGNLGYDFIDKGLSYTAVTFNRKLHCWNMSVSWFPERGNTFSFFIGVNSNTIGFLKYNYGQNVFDGFNSTGRF